VDLYINSPIRLRGVVLNSLNTGTNLSFHSFSFYPLICFFFYFFFVDILAFIPFPQPPLVTKPEKLFMLSATLIFSY
jgi:hypothetical protein